MKIREAGSHLGWGFLFAIFFCVPVSFITDLRIVDLLTSPWTLLAISLPLWFATCLELLIKIDTKAGVRQPAGKRSKTTSMSSR